MSQNNNTFLRGVASAYINNICVYGNELESYTFIFPNRRSSLFFQKYLGEEYGKKFNKPLFTPKIITINELFQLLSGLKLADSLEALYILYQEYEKLRYNVEPVNSVNSANSVNSVNSAMSHESFDEFYSWGNLIIKDFNDIDTYLADPTQIFSNIKDLREIEDNFTYLTTAQKEAISQFWGNFIKGGRSDNKDFFVGLWDVMNELYNSFNDRLFEKGLAYSGKIYRLVSEKLDNEGYFNVIKDIIPNSLVFIGFNAPNKCEQNLMRSAMKHGMADFYWDYYGDMITDKSNKASAFISDFKREFPSKIDITSDVTVSNNEKRYVVEAVPSAVGQTYALNKILTEIADNSNIKDNKDNKEDWSISTAVILPDESLLMSVINSIPSAYDKINVTMGYPLKITPVFSFVNYLCSIQNEFVEKKMFYHRTVLDILSHEYINNYIREESRELRAKIISGNIIYIAPSDEIVLNIESPFLKKIFRTTDTIESLGGYIIDILKELESLVPKTDRDFIFRYFQLINRIGNLNIPLSREMYNKILFKAASDITIPFNGEPLHGLQIMGPLETRSLDFDNVIILSANDGVFPNSNMPQSLIPYNLRCGFGLPTYEMSDTISAYHFYRGIYRAKNIFMLYDSRSEGIKSGEMSRYIMQLKYCYNVNLQEYTCVTNIDNKDVVEIPKVEKNSDIMTKLNSYLYPGKSALSASAINTYLACPLQFYFTYVERISKEESVSEALESDTFGVVFHSVMEKLYKSKINKVLSENELSNMAQVDKIDSLVDNEIKNVLNINEVSGQNIITKEIIKKYVVWTLDKDKLLTPFTYLQGEKRYESVIEITKGRRVRIKGIIDRIDKIGDTIRISDYKTGSIEAAKTGFDISALFDRDAEKRYNYLLQLFFYSLIFTSVEGASDFFNCSVYPIRKLSHNNIISHTISYESIQHYKELLTECIEEIFNPDIPFNGRESGNKSCSYCNFKTICNR